MNAVKRKCGRPPKERTVNSVSAAVFALRSKLGLSQQAMSQELGMAMVTIAKYEAGRVPDFLSLVKLEKLARRSRNEEIAEIFRSALIENLGVWGEAGNTLSLSIGETVKKLRQNLQLSQEALARAIDVTVRSVSRYEAGEEADVRSLSKLEEYATAIGAHEEAKNFKHALAMKAGKSHLFSMTKLFPVTDYEAAMVDALLSAIRNPKLAVAVKQIEQHLVRSAGLALPEKTR
jgi:transcriptional regulator with XRE-family HTH domain